MGGMEDSQLQNADASAPSWPCWVTALESAFSTSSGDSMGFPGGSDGKKSACNAGDSSLIPGSGRSPGEGNGYPL